MVRDGSKVARRRKRLSNLLPMTRAGPPKSLSSTESRMTYVNRSEVSESKHHDLSPHFCAFEHTCVNMCQ